MMQYVHLEHRFVQYLPEQLEPGVLYISMEYATAAHSCCCGCEEQVVTPFTPTDWKMIYDGETVSLWPSIGNWNMACRSHYFIERNCVKEALPWKDGEVAAGRRRDKAAKARFFEESAGAQAKHNLCVSMPTRENAPGLWKRLKGWFSRTNL